MTAKNIINSLINESKNLPEAIAPVLVDNEKIKVFINNHPYKFKLTNKGSGWSVLKPDSLNSAKIVREAMAFEIDKCLKSVPELRVIVMRRINDSRWIVYPFNVSDAALKGIDARPLEVFLVNRNLEPFSIISTRIWGNKLIFDTYISAPNDAYYKNLEKGNIEPPKIPGTTPEFKSVYSMLTDEIEKMRKLTIEGQIKTAVEYLGAKLVGFKEFGEGYEVEYRDGGDTYKLRISSGLRLSSAGICLSGLENQQTLTSSVAVMRRSRNRNQYFNNFDADDYTETEY